MSRRAIMVDSCRHCPRCRVSDTWRAHTSGGCLERQCLGIPRTVNDVDGPIPDWCPLGEVKP